MVKTSDFESENSGSSPGEAATVADLQDKLCDAHEIKERAFLIVYGPPFNMGVSEENYANLEIDGDKATLVWPEYTSDYYGGGYLEQQTVSFPSELLLMTVDEIKIWKDGEQKKYDQQQWIAGQEAKRRREEWQTAQELQALAFLKQKYGA